ncbi:MAG: exodeoxyribonuclease VII small subunit [Prevotellaceae bacterium]|jgi:exodeoxyribonuclease VII small subunit|nr:exodeoxyribonuclease VII small subunit [Prevotellaceae bacterium]
MAKKSTLAYSEAINEIETILAQIENDELEMDDLIEKVKRSSELLQFCKNKLTQTDVEIQKILESITN